MIAGGELGEVYHVHTLFKAHRSIPGLGGWFTSKRRSGGGVMIDWGVHFIDLILYCLSGPELLTVSGVAHARLGASLREYAYLDMFQAEIDAFLDSAASGEPCVADIDAVLPTQRVLDGFYRSARLGREVRL